MSIRVFVLVILSSTDLFGQKMVGFSFSECLKECANDSSQVEAIVAGKHFTVVVVKTYAPCNGNLQGNVEFKNGFLDLHFSTKPTIYKSKGGVVTEVVEVADCNCVFYLRYEISGLRDVDNGQVKVNGLTLREMNARRTKWNDEIDFKFNEGE